MQTVVKVKVMPRFRLKVTFDDGFTGQVDLKDHLRQSDWPIAQPLKQRDFFCRAHVQDGSIVWPNGYDICPDVLRFWCEVGHATGQAETDAHFATATRAAAGPAA